MSIELKGTAQNHVVGKLPKYTASLTGDLKGIECKITLIAERESDITSILPIFSRDLEIVLIDKNKNIDDFYQKEPAILEEFVLGFPVEKVFVGGQCSECGADLWKDPADLEVLCVACQKEIASDKFRKETKEWIKQKRTAPETKEECPVFKLPDETWEEYEARKQLIEEQQFRAERHVRAEAQA